MATVEWDETDDGVLTEAIDPEESTGRAFRQTDKIFVSSRFFLDQFVTVNGTLMLVNPPHFPTRTSATSTWVTRVRPGPNETGTQEIGEA